VRLRSILSSVALVAGSIAFFWLLIPVQRDPLGMPLIRAAFGYNADMEAAFVRRIALRDTARALETRLTRAEIRVRARALGADRRTGLIVVGDSGVAAAYRAHAEKVAQTELAALGVASARGPVRVVVSAVEPLTTFPQYRRAVVLPEQAGAPCVVVLQMLGPARPLRILGYDRLLGTCAFFAKYGEPGEGMREWLRVTGARRAGWLQRPENVRGGRITDQAEINGLARVPYLGTCRVGVLAACDSLWAATGGERAVQSWARDAVAVADPVTDVLLTQPNSFYGTSSPFTFGLLAELAAALGDERFGEWWSSAGDVDESYARVAGVTLAAGIEQLLTARMAEYEAGPTVKWSQGLATLVLIGATFGLALRFSRPALT
jgi:hypothetical protein